MGLQPYKHMAGKRSGHDGGLAPRCTDDRHRPCFSAKQSPKAHLWLQLRPGTDAALALGMLHVIIHEGLYDKEFVEQWCFGFKELKERVQQFTPEKVEEVTWVPKKQD